MEPAIEVATLVVSYLWAFRDLFPDRPSVDDFPAGELHQDLTLACADDVAMAIRLADIASRTADEHWVSQPPEASPDVEFDRAVEAEQQRHRPSVVRMVRLSRADFTTSLSAAYNALVGEQVDESHIASAAWELTGTYAAHAETLLRRFGDLFFLPSRAAVEAPTRPATRELAARMVAERLLSNAEGVRLADVAKALDYRPLLLRALDTKASSRRMSELIHTDRLFTESVDPFVNAVRDLIARGLHHDAMTALLSDPNYPQVLTAMCDRLGQPIPFPLVLHRELDEIQLQRRCRWHRECEPRLDEANQLSAVRAFNSCLFGVGFSGGGIRSATFNLGVLQALASHGWLPHIDYLSTVSGGGYIGGWLLAWIKRRGTVASVQDSLRGFEAAGPDAKNNPDPATEHVRPIRWLREYSNYLAPVPGWLSADSWTMVAIWMRNTTLNLLVLGLFLMGALMLPRLGGALLSALPSSSVAWAASALCFWAAACLIGINLDSFDAEKRSWFGGDQREAQRGDTTLLILLTIVAPSIVGAGLVTIALWWMDPPIGGERFVVSPAFLWPFAIFAVGVLITALIGYWSFPAVRGTRTVQRTRVRASVAFARRATRSALSGVIAAACGGLLMYGLWLNTIPSLAQDTQWGLWIAVSFGPSAVLLIITSMLVIYLGLEGFAFPDDRREWWSRLGAWLGLLGAGWLALAAIGLFAPVVVAMVGLRLTALVGTLGWGGVVYGGVKLAAGGKSNGINLKLDSNPFASALVKAAPYAFIAGFLVVLSLLSRVLLFKLWRYGLVAPGASEFPPLPFDLRRYVDTYWATMYARDWITLAIPFGLIVLSWALAWRVDVNEFSMHHFYRNRLVRAYLGASRSRVHRRPNAFTGFDLDDDVKLWRFRHDDEAVPNDVTSDCRRGYCGPYPIINATLNTMSGENLAWQDRKGQSYVFSPLYSGYDFASKQNALPQHAREQFAYRPSTTFVQTRERFGKRFRTRTTVDSKDRDSGLGIGTAVAISGAAANPNAGYHTSPAVAFLLTVLNARLGWWVRNPRMSREASCPDSPRSDLIYLLSELFGFTGTNRTYVNLSDGGHFDNMGLYELVRRRCRYIVICDAEEDEANVFDGIASAIRKCRIDFGVAIDLPLEKMKRRKPDGPNRQHAVMGTIIYPYDVGEGRILYLKSSLTGNEPADVQEYKQLHKEFPHQSTVDQFFDENQFESYRALGQFIGDGLFGDWTESTMAGATHCDDLGAAFDAIADRLS